LYSCGASKFNWVSKISPVTLFLPFSPLLYPLPEHSVSV
jgi:hypothetical protein